MRLIDTNHLIADFMGAKFGIDPSLCPKKTTIKNN